MKVICFGNRGSRALGASDESPFGQYGGDTTSVGVICDDGTIIALDAGSGAWKWPYTLREPLGIKGPIKMHMFFSHYHDDHKTGFPQLEQLFVPGNEFHLYGPGKKDLYPSDHPKKNQFSLKRMFEQKTSADNPALSSVYNAKISLTKLRDTSKKRNSVIISDDGVKVSWIRVGHGSQSSFGYRIDHGGQSFSMISDTHHTVDKKGKPELDEDILRFIKGSDVFMSDCHYTDKEFNKNPDFCGKAMGHSTGEQGVRLSDAAGVPIFIPHHYAPTKVDSILDAEMNDLRTYARQFKGVSVVPARPSLVIDLSVEPKNRVRHMLTQSTPALRQQAIKGKLAI